MKATKYPYNTNLAKGTSFVNETMTLLEFYENGESKQEFLLRCVSENILDKSTELRSKDIINLVFFDRYWKSTNGIVKGLKEMRENGLSLSALKSLMYVYTARANKVFYDFVLELQVSYKNKKITTSIANSFLLKAISLNKAPSWSDSMIKRVSSYLVSCLKDFDLLDSSGYLNIGFPDQKIISYLLHELHFQNKNENEIINDSVWLLLGLSISDIIKEIEKISFKGTFIFQYSGEILKIGWNYQNMDEFIENEYR
jgi:hypothetical protein